MSTQMTWEAELDRAMKRAAKSGYAVIGFAVKPDEGGMIKLDNQGMNREQFTAMLGTSLAIYEQHTTDAQLLVAQGEC